MQHELVVLSDVEALSREGAHRVAEKVRAVAGEGRACNIAVSGGRTPWAMFRQLAQMDLPWSQLRIFQVDERVAPNGDPDRNLTSLVEAFSDTAVEIVPMPVTDTDLESAAADYAARLPDEFDLIHLGLGSDGHTASLVPGDPVLNVDDLLVALTQPYQGHRRMTLTFPALASARELVWLVAGGDKKDALAKLLRLDPSIPAGRVRATQSMVLADRLAAPN